jgi:thioredoxin 2
MTDPLMIPCAECAGLNRIPAARLGDAPRCGHCKAAVLPAAPFDLNEASFAKQLRGDLPLLVDVWADWCGPCKAFAPTYQQAAGQLQGRSSTSARSPPLSCSRAASKSPARAAPCHCRNCSPG